MDRDLSSQYSHRKVASSIGKCRFEEVDFSMSLRQDLYAKEEMINRLRARLRQQQGQVCLLVCHLS